MSLKRTVAALLLCTSLATPAVAQNTDLPDVSIVATAPRVDLNAQPPDPVRNAIVATQDINFFERYPAPSTLTQQITSTYTLPTNRTLTNKVTELAFALNLSSTFTPDEILTIYSQTIYLGARCFGFADALNHRMGIDIDDATLRDTLTLAALIAHPVLGEYDPDRFVTRFGFAAGIGADVGLWDDDMKNSFWSLVRPRLSLAKPALIPDIEQNFQ